MREGWTYKTFGEVGSFLRGKSIQKADFIENTNMYKRGSA